MYASLSTFKTVLGKWDRHAVYLGHKKLRVLHLVQATQSSTKYRWSQRSESNRRPAVYETAALPLSYAGFT